MSQKLLQPKKRRIAPVKGSVAEPRKMVLLGTYAENQLEAWPGYYPYPLAAQDEVDADACKAVNEIWLFKGGGKRQDRGVQQQDTAAHQAGLRLPRLQVLPAQDI